MPKMAAQAVSDLSQLTDYAVIKESWIMDGRGHSELRVPAAEGQDPVRVSLHPKQAEYLIHAEQVAPIPGVTKGYPADVSTGEAIKLSHEERARIQEAPSIGDATGQANETGTGGVASSGQSPNAVDQVDATQTGGEETLTPTTDPAVPDTGTEATAKTTGKKRS